MLIITYYSNDGYKFMADRLKALCESWNLPFKAYSREELEKSSFYVKNRRILDEPKGNGYWAWKPHIILTSLLLDDVVVYLDSSVIPDSKLAIVEMVRRTKNVSAVGTAFPNNEWTKRYCFKAMKCDMPKYWQPNQVWAGVVVAKFSGLDIVRDWLFYCSDYDIISDSPSNDNFPDFKEHRHDQSILTNLLIKYGENILPPNKFKDVVQYS